MQAMLPGDCQAHDSPTLKHFTNMMHHISPAAIHHLVAASPGCDTEGKIRICHMRSSGIPAAHRERGTAVMRLHAHRPPGKR